MRLPVLVSTAAVGLPTAASAHIGHIGTLAGHDHWVAGAAIGAAVAVTIWGAMAGKKSRTAEQDDDPEAEDLPEAEEA